MKKKLKIVFILISVALFGIIVFQAYWAVNAYHFNKKKFDADIDIAMQKAMDDCKKDYFDSIRVVLIRRLSDTGFKIKVDTMQEADTANAELTFHFSDQYTTFLDPPFRIPKSRLNYYRSMIKHPATLPEVLTEASFYIPQLMQQYTLILGMEDIRTHPKEQAEFNKYNNSHITVPEDTMLKIDRNETNTIYAFPKNYRQADSLKLQKYFTAELVKMHSWSPFVLNFSTKHTEPARLNYHYSETNEYSYKYHGFKVFNIIGPEFFARAVFGNSQHIVIKGMLTTLSLSLLLIIFTIYCFFYIIKIIREQKKLAELKDDFINNMTHELKTPIATIGVAIEGLQKFNALNDPEKTQRYLQTSKNELSRLNDLVTRVLNIAAYENKEIDLVKENINIDALINEVIDSEKVKSDKKVIFNYTNKDNIKLIQADQTHFRNVLVNLVGNAVKYAKEPVNVDIACYRSGNYVAISVKDSGPGISAEHLGQIFDKFYRVPTGNLHNVKGTGLGLSYVKYIVEAHGGKVTAKSEINTGSEFIVSIPLGNG